MVFVRLPSVSVFVTVNEFRDSDFAFVDVVVSDCVTNAVTEAVELLLDHVTISVKVVCWVAVIVSLVVSVMLPLAVYVRLHWPRENVSEMVFDKAPVTEEVLVEEIVRMVRLLDRDSENVILVLLVGVGGGVIVLVSVEDNMLVGDVDLVGVSVFVGESERDEVDVAERVGEAEVELEGVEISVIVRDFVGVVVLVDVSEIDHDAVSVSDGEPLSVGEADIETESDPLKVMVEVDEGVAVREADALVL